MEYTPVRHRSAIERVLAALQGRDPQLDSAIKLWTTFAVAKYFEITHSPLEDYIIRWLRAYPNSFFLEVLPEASHQIADGLQNSDLARDTFAILVGEEALDSLRRHRELHGFYKHNSYGRKKEELPEHIHTRIEYASKNFLRRINNDFNNLAGTRMQWIEDLPEVQMLSSYTQPEIQPTIEALKVLLKDYVRGTIYKLLCANYDSMPQPELHHEGGHDLLPRLSRSLVWCNMTKNERIMSRTFWEALKSFTIFKGNTNLDVSGGWDMWERHASYLSTVEKRELDQGTYRKIELEELKALFREGERFLNDEKPNPLITLPFRPSRAARSPSMVPSEQSSLHKTDDTSALACASSPTLTPPIDIPELSRSAQRDSDGEVTLSDDKLNVTHVQAKKWPHGLAREYPMPGVQRDIEGLHVSSPPSAERDAAEEVPKAMAFANPESWDAKYGCADDLQQSSDVSSPKTYNRIFFHLPTFFRQVEEYIDSFARRKLQSSDQSTRAEPLEVGITNTLVCLEDEEWKYLPPWAGGNDDGSMGVYNDDIPFADQVFSTPGPGVHDGTAPTPSSGAPSEFEMVTERPDSSVFNTSTATNRDFSDALRCRRVHIAESADMSSNDGFTIVTPLVDSDDEEKLARKQMEAQESIEAAEEAATNKALRFGRENGMTIDEDDGSADLFNSDDEDTDRADDGDLDGEEEEDMVMV